GGLADGFEIRRPSPKRRGCAQFIRHPKSDIRNPPVTPQRWRQIKAVFQVAAELEPGRRAAYLDQACAGEPALRREVEALLSASGDAEDFIEKPALEQNAAALIENLPDPVIGRRAGVYKMIGEVGRGGMGAVYKAVRDDDHFHRQVAIKIVKR